MGACRLRRVDDRWRSTDGRQAVGQRPGRAGPRDRACDQSALRLKRSRKKKLIVAFHFQLANQAAWECDTCRNSGLEKRRRCTWIGDEGSDERIAGPIWARGRASSSCCPKSYVTGESLALLEEFHAFKVFGSRDVYALEARLVEAIFILEDELRREKDNAER